ncbi:MAG: hypothetical protein AAGD01_01290 [Acidobacteriota bacterium]
MIETDCSGFFLNEDWMLTPAHCSARCDFGIGAINLSPSCNIYLERPHSRFIHPKWTGCKRLKDGPCIYPAHGDAQLIQVKPKGNRSIPSLSEEIPESMKLRVLGYPKAQISMQCNASPSGEEQKAAISASVRSVINDTSTPEKREKFELLQTREARIIQLEEANSLQRKRNIRIFALESDLKDVSLDACLERLSEIESLGFLVDLLLCTSVENTALEGLTEGVSGGTLALIGKDTNHIIGMVNSRDITTFDDVSILRFVTIRGLMPWISCITKKELDSDGRLTKQLTDERSCLSKCEEAFPPSEASKIQDHCSTDFTD